MQHDAAFFQDLHCLPRLNQLSDLVALLLLSFRMSCDCKCSVVLLHSAVCWSAVCDCGISYPYSLTKG